LEHFFGALSPGGAPHQITLIFGGSLFTALTFCPLLSNGFIRYESFKGAGSCRWSLEEVVNCFCLTEGIRSENVTSLCIYDWFLFY